VQALRQVDEWRAANAGVAVVGREGTRAVRGPRELPLPWASVTKLATALAALVAAEEGTIELGDAAGPDGSTIRHLLAHASGLAPDGLARIAQPGERRIYSNSGFELVAEAIAKAAEMPFEAYLREAVLEPLGLSARLEGSAASGLRGSVDDLARLGRELLSPTLVAPETLAEATEVQFPDLIGVLPGFGRMVPNDWGLGFELRDAKAPHWTGRRNSPRAFGHFGRTGTFLWVDPEARLALACLTDLTFGEWAREAWPRLADAVLAEAAESA
jgi:CubicO group peptidase (beta-lactamase class C family)